MKCNTTTHGFVSGNSSVYQKFWEDRIDDINVYSHGERKEIADYLTWQVFGAPPTDEDHEDHEMQMAFNHAIQQQISARAAKKDGEGGEQTGGGDNEGSEGEENEGEGSGGEGDEGAGSGEENG